MVALQFEKVLNLLVSLTRKEIWNTSISMQSQTGNSGWPAFLKGGPCAERTLARTIFWRVTNFLTKNAPKFSPTSLSLYFVGPEEKEKPQFPAIFASEKFSKFHRRASAGAQGEHL